MIKQLDENAARKLFKEQKYGHLGCILAGGEPYVVPVNYLYLDDEIYIHSLPGNKIDALRLNGKICLQVEKIKDSYQWQSAIGFGEFQEIKKKQVVIRILHEFTEHFPRMTPVEGMITDEDVVSELVLFRIDIKKISGIEEK
jgi:nitroimidazol reductase NimA-like FMN-containing flavoprotein (pyridoxamine 5'-phosphate oxidase superfamily)